MSLQNIILGLLRSPSSGYGIQARLKSDCDHFWSASLSQIYPLLTRMEQEGLLHSGLASSRKGPQRRLHGLTDAGRQALIEALNEPPRIGPERLSWLASVSQAGAHPEASGAQHQLTRLHQLFTEQCARLQAHGGAQASPPSQPDAFFERAARRCALATAQARLAWCEETLMDLESVNWEAAPGEPPGAPPGPVHS